MRKVRDVKSGPHAARAVSAPGELAAAFFADFLADWREHGPAAIAAMRGEKVTDYVKLAAALAPKAPSHDADPLKAMSDAELDRAIRECAALVGLEVRAGAAVRRGSAAKDDDGDAG